MGYTAAEGLILTGQGSTSDITLKNDADAVVFTVPTGTDDILFPDSAQVIFGAGSDLSINHDGAHSNIVDSGTGDLRIRADNLRLSRSNDSEIFLYCTTDAGVQIYENGLEKLTTVDKGVEVKSSKNGVDTELTITETAGNNAYLILKSNRDQSGSTYRDNAINSYARGNGDTTGDVMGTSIEFASIQGSSDGKIKGEFHFKVANDATSASTTALTITHEGKVRADATIGAWVNFNQTGSIAIGTSYNVSSIADQAVGQTTVNFATDYSTAPCWSTDTDTVSITGHQYVAAGQIQILVKTHDNNFQDVQGCAVITVGEV
jgi:hypothetical protein